MALKKQIWTKSSIIWIVSDVDEHGTETERKVVLRRSRRLVEKYPPLIPEEVRRLHDTWGYVVSQELELEGIATIVFVLEYYKEGSAAHVVKGPYRLAEE
jgi:hypothetical protein